MHAGALEEVEWLRAKLQQLEDSLRSGSGGSLGALGSLGAAAAAAASAAFPFQPLDHQEAFTPTGNPVPTAAEEGMAVFGSTEGPAAEEAPPEAFPAPGTGASGEEAGAAPALAAAASGQGTEGSEPAGKGPAPGCAPGPQRAEAAAGEGQPLEEVPSARSVASARSTASARSRRASALEVGSRLDSRSSEEGLPLGGGVTAAVTVLPAGERGRGKAAVAEPAAAPGRRSSVGSLES